VGIIGNGFLLNRLCGRRVGGADAFDLACWTNLPGQRNRMAVLDEGLGGMPNGALPPIAWVMPISAGAISSSSFGDSTITAPIIPALLAQAGLTGSGDVTPLGSMIYYLASTVSGASAVAANASAIAIAAAGLTGSMSMAATLGAFGGLSSALVGEGVLAPDIMADGNVDAALDGTSVLAADGALLAQMVAALLGLGTLTADATGVADMASAASGSGTVSATLGSLAAIFAAISGDSATVAALVGYGNSSAEVQGSGTITADPTMLAYILAALVGGSDVSANNGAYGVIASPLSGTASLAASIGASAWMLSALQGTGSASGSTQATGDMSASILSYSSMTPEGIRDAVWRAISSQFNDPGTMGEKLNSAGSASNPWTDPVGIQVSSDVAAILATVLTMPEDTSDALLDRNLAGGSNGGRTVRDALRALRNKTAIVGNTLVVYTENDTAAAWAAAVTTSPRDPLQSVDPS
jgi:trimeric autotransporter adhesin